MKIDRKELLTALEPLKPALSNRGAVVELSHIWFDSEFAYAHDGGMGVRVKLETPFKLGVPGNLLLGLLNQAGAESLTLDAKEDTLAFKAGKSNVKLATLPLDSRVWPYPEKPTSKPVATIKVSEALIAGLKQVFVVKPSNPTRMEHHGVSIFPVEKEVDLYTTDSKMVAVTPVTEPLVGKIKSAVLPRNFAEQLVAQCKAGAELKLYSDCFTVTASPKVTLYSNVFDTSDMYDMPSIADKFSDEKAAPPFKLPEGFSGTLERAVLMAGADEPAVQLITDGKTLLVTGRFKYGELSEQFAVDKALPKCAVLVLAKQLLAPKDIERMMISKDGVTLRGKDGFMFITAPYHPGAKGAKAAKKSE